MIRHLLVTNDFPPKVGGIQSYLWELWRRLPSDQFAVMTTPYPGAAAFDAGQPFRIVRTKDPVLLPHRHLARRIDRVATEIDADLVVLDPALPLGHLGRWLDHRYGVVLHGAEVTVPGRLPGSRQMLRRVLRDSELVIAAGGYPLAEGERAAGRRLPAVVIPPGVDVSRFTPMTDAERRAVRSRYGIDPDAQLVLGLSRLVPRKGLDTLIEASARLRWNHPNLMVAIAGKGRDRDRLEEMAKTHDAPVMFLGRVPDEDLGAIHGAADVFAMLCRNRWGGLEQEGYGIVFVEAAAAGVPSIAGLSGGSHEAVVDGETGLVVGQPEDIDQVTDALRRLLDDPQLRHDMGSAARRRAERELSYDVLAERLWAALQALA